VRTYAPEEKERPDDAAGGLHSDYSRMKTVTFMVQFVVLYIRSMFWITPLTSIRCGCVMVSAHNPVHVPTRFCFPCHEESRLSSVFTTACTIAAFVLMLKAGLKMPSNHTVAVLSSPPCA
jgi:hypothetical protein